MSLQELKLELQEKGYIVNIPSNSKRIVVMGYGKRYFNAKKAKAVSITTDLILQGYNVKTVKEIDGYYDFYVYLS